jgi:pimeloyl-ACP methyl ester carboxylesterase
MPIAVIDGIATRYEVLGAGPPLLMYAPGGFDATIEKWSTQGIYAQIKPLEQLSRHFRCIVFDRRETGQSGGRVEKVTWSHYVAQGLGLLDHLGIEKAHVIGGCMGCCSAAAMGVAHPDRVLSLILFWPVGGARYRINAQQRFMTHLSFVQQNGLGAVTEVALEGKSFGADPRGGPWAAVLRHDAAFASEFSNQDPARYALIVGAMARSLIDRDTVPGAEPEDLLCLQVPALIVPGADASHATSAAHFLRECINGAQYWDVPVQAQTEAATGPRLVEFLKEVPIS